MDAVNNPFNPGAGTSPPELAGREEIRNEIGLALARAKRGRPGKSALLIGLRGVGKTVLLNRLQQEAEGMGISLEVVEMSENRSLPALLLPRLQAAVLALSQKERARELAARALRAMSGFMRTLKIEYNGVALNFAPEPGLADSGDLEADLSALLVESGRAAAAENTCLAFFIDELQYAKKADLSALIAAMHRTAQKDLPVMMAAAGLPHLRGLVGRAKTYAERMFDFYEIGALAEKDAAHALRKPARDNGADFTEKALDEIIRETRGYPYFLQEWGKHAWNAAPAAPIGADDVLAASARAKASLDAGFFRVRMERLTPLEKRYLRAMAKIGKETMRTGEIARTLKKRINQVAPVRAQLISKGMIWSPGHGEAAFTVPLFGEYLRRNG
ncbi:MAG: ATP-binding protein [Betaproteobacteria bacterium]|nr:ATP-binding protein [Betaproteobacteria bacterium]